MTIIYETASFNDNQNKSILDLNDDIYEIVFKYLRLVKICNLKRVNKYFFNLSHSCKFSLDNYKFYNTLEEWINLLNEKLKTFRSNLSLKSLELSICQSILDFPSEILEIPNLKRFYLYRNKFNPEMCQFTNLDKLTLSDNLLEKLPSEIGNMCNLTQLEITRNQITCIPNEIGNLKSFKRLYLNNNMLITLPPEIENLKELRELKLENNQISYIPPEIGKLLNLLLLFLNNNELSSIPKEICQLSQLGLLRIDMNKLTSFPLELLNLNQLREMWLNDNQIQFPPQFICDKELLAIKRYFNRVNSLKILLKN